MKFRALQENLRKTLRQRIEQGELTGMRLAEETGFKQAHISNFLNRKRGLSLEGMDKLLHVQRLSVLDLLDPGEVSKRASIIPPSEDEFESVAVADAQIAANEPLILSMHVREILKFKKSSLHRIRCATARERAGWTRFVAIKVDAREALTMHPRLLAGATVVIDRHHNSLLPHRRGEPTLYAVRREQGCVIRYVEVANQHLVLRPCNPNSAVDLLPVVQGTRPSDYIVGHVCYVGLEM